ncbi:MAG: cytochrome C biogenesis protein [Crocinitomicaceae bacterium]|nr:cytochrome C biogenesis protein [Crocinitomicaceae bacterium]|tara:strand:- start:2349 stop:2771 length:423 start_codon:yes stop_codon:yes gene_type:complete
MKKTHIAGIIIIAIAIAAIIGTLSDSSTYANFTEAFDNPSAEFHVVGVLNRDKETVYNPEENPNEFIFYMIDKENVEKKVVLHRTKPQDFERSEQIVIIGKAVEGDFHANQILMKCPSKYNDGSGEFKTPEEHKGTNAAS